MASSRRVWQAVCMGAFGLLVAGPFARAQALEVAAFEESAAQLTPAAVIEGRYTDRFQPVPARGARLPGQAQGELWLRLAFELPDGGDPHERPLALRLDRVPLDSIRVFMPQVEGGHVELSDAFFAPGTASELAAHAYAFAIPHHLQGAQVVYVALRGRAGVSLRPQLVAQRELQVEDRNVTALLSAVYASIAVLALSALALFLALRDRAYLHFCLLTASLLLLLLALNGHLYRWPPFAWMAWWHYHGIHALAAVCCALALEFTRHFLETPQRDAPGDRALRGLRWLLYGLAALALLNLDALVRSLQLAAVWGGVLTTLTIVAVALRAWRRGELLARPYCLVWLMLVGAAAVRAALTQGWLPPSPSSLYGFQLATAFCLFLISIGLADRVMEFRKQRDRARQLKEQTDASLQLEQVRRRFSDSVREQVRAGTPGGDLEWVALHRMLVSLQGLLPQHGAAVIARGYRGQDLLLVEPLVARDRYARLAEIHGARLRAVCRGGSPEVLALAPASSGDGDAPPEDAGVFALVPLPLTAPGWGVLLVERGPGEDFTAAEIGLAADFLKLALALSDEAARQAELKHKAEIDPLTAAYNRRAGDALLAQAWERSLAERKPFSLLFVDLDHFKRVNDQHGHAVGDDCLRRAAAALRHEIRADDVLVRYGGEEFLVVLPGLGAEPAVHLGERVREAILALRVDSGEAKVRFSVSIGVASRLPGEDQVQDLVARADRALYAAKRSGRNQVHLASQAVAGRDGTDRGSDPSSSRA